MNPPPNREVALFGAAIGLPPGQRAAYLDGACADDPDLRLRVEVLLRVHEEAIPFLENAPPGNQEPPMGPQAPGATVRLSAALAEKGENPSNRQRGRKNSINSPDSPTKP